MVRDDYFDARSEVFNTKDNPYNSSGFVGKKVRVMEVSRIQYGQSMGGSPTLVSTGIVITHFQQGIVDARRIISSFVYSKHYEVCKSIGLDEHAALLMSSLSSTRFGNHWLTGATWASRGGRWIRVYQYELWQLQLPKSMRELEKAGVLLIIRIKLLFARLSKGSTIRLAIEQPEIIKSQWRFKQLINAK